MLLNIGFCQLSRIKIILENKAISSPISKLLMVFTFTLSLYFLKEDNYWMLIIEYFSLESIIGWVKSLAIF